MPRGISEILSIHVAAQTKLVFAEVLKDITHATGSAHSQTRPLKTNASSKAATSKVSVNTS
jgi:hypothetical protein